MLALLLLAPLALVQAALPAECYNACKAFSDQYTTCGGDLHDQAQKCITCVSKEQDLDAWAGVEEACRYTGSGVKDAKDDVKVSASELTSAAAPANATGATGSKTAGSPPTIGRWNVQFDLGIQMYAFMGIASATVLHLIC
ncbi:hypothetical protein CspeluHIS016_0113480 [Cutaneotrichosporon spelunceum]|uniref:Extracellular membrane protein CFEM domain-containing protein n=1 Tax=Cutaneotrichosporon spelunceum TaxID=1672016 RepID=A0AAD3TQU1_9TREE|nr:hypothetical protein CspeluHIS016_0113480 [Cutaneotrichosporon spelunceum]